MMFQSKFRRYYMEPPAMIYLFCVLASIDKKFYTRNNLALHSKFHMNERRFKCSFCDKRFTQSGDVKTHERIHTGDKPYQCNVCDKSFRSVGNRRDHIATHADVDAPKVKVSGYGTTPLRIIQNINLCFYSAKYANRASSRNAFCAATWRYTIRTNASSVRCATKSSTASIT